MGAFRFLTIGGILRINLGGRTGGGFVYESYGDPYIYLRMDPVCPPDSFLKYSSGKIIFTSSFAFSPFQ